MGQKRFGKGKSTLEPKDIQNGFKMNLCQWFMVLKKLKAEKTLCNVIDTDFRDFSLQYICCYFYLVYYSFFFVFSGKTSS